jgi:hypothetical protein
MDTSVRKSERIFLNKCTFNFVKVVMQTPNEFLSHHKILRMSGQYPHHVPAYQ